MTEVRPFTIAVAQDKIDDLHSRLEQPELFAGELRKCFALMR